MSKSARQIRLEAAIAEMTTERADIAAMPASALRTKMLSVADVAIQNVKEQINLEDSQRLAALDVEGEDPSSFLVRMRMFLDDTEWAAYKAEAKEGKQLVRRFFRKHI